MIMPLIDFLIAEDASRVFVPSYLVISWYDPRRQGAYGEIRTCRQISRRIPFHDKIQLLNVCVKQY